MAGDLIGVAIALTLWLLARKLPQRQRVQNVQFLKRRWQDPS